MEVTSGENRLMSKEIFAILVEKHYVNLLANPKGGTLQDPKLN